MNEFKRMQKLAGLITESEYRESLNEAEIPLDIKNFLLGMMDSFSEGNDNEYPAGKHMEFKYEEEYGDEDLYDEKTAKLFNKSKLFLSKNGPVTIQDTFAGQPLDLTFSIDGEDIKMEWIEPAINESSLNESKYISSEEQEDEDFPVLNDDAIRAYLKSVIDPEYIDDVDTFMDDEEGYGESSMYFFDTPDDEDPFTIPDSEVERWAKQEMSYYLFSQPDEFPGKEMNEAEILREEDDWEKLTIDDVKAAFPDKTFTDGGKVDDSYKVSDSIVIPDVNTAVEILKYLDKKMYPYGIGGDPSEITKVWNRFPKSTVKMALPMFRNQRYAQIVSFVFDDGSQYPPVFTYHGNHIGSPLIWQRQGNASWQDWSDTNPGKSAGDFDKFFAQYNKELPSKEMNELSLNEAEEVYGGQSADRGATGSSIEFTIVDNTPEYYTIDYKITPNSRYSSKTASRYNVREPKTGTQRIQKNPNDVQKEWIRVNGEDFLIGKSFAKEIYPG